MALLILDANKLLLEVRVGILEDYTPDKEIIAINSRLGELKLKTESKLKEITGVEDFAEGMEQLKNDKDKNDTMLKYIVEEFKGKLESIVTRIDKKNNKICPGYKKVKK